MIVETSYNQFLTAVQAEEAKILERDGTWHVGEVYYASEADASIHRRWLAEKTVNEAARLRIQEAHVRRMSA